jgi:hypothetical protein
MPRDQCCATPEMGRIDLMIDIESNTSPNKGNREPTLAARRPRSVCCPSPRMREGAAIVNVSCGHTERDGQNGGGRRAIRASVPMTRPAHPEEIAPSIVSFASPMHSSYITGEVLALLGGETTAA